MAGDYLLTAFVTLFVVIDPIGLAPMFLSIAGGLPRDVQRRVALRSALVTGAVLLAFALVGATLLEWLGISLAAIRIAGGILLFWIAFEMVFERRRTRKEAQVGGLSPAERTEEAYYTAVVPLAVPLSAGPGAISATILTASGAADGWVLLGLLGIIVALAVSCYLVFLAATRVERVLGETGRNVLTRLLGILLAALAVQFVAAGLEGPFTPGVPPTITTPVE